MTRLLPDRPALSRSRRSLGALPHGLPTALTLLISIAAVLLGSSLIVGTTLTATASTPRGEHAIATAERQTIARTFASLADGAPLAATGSTARQLPPSRPETTSGTSRVVRVAGETAPNAGGGAAPETARPTDPPPVEDPGSDAPGSLAGGASDQPDDEPEDRDQAGGSPGGRGGGAPELAPTHEPEHEDETPEPVPTPEPERPED